MQISTFNQILGITQSSLLANMLDLDTTSNNLANVNTVGFKASRSSFDELLNDKNQLNGTYIDGTQRLLTQGSLKTSENPLDMAIEGDGFFGVRMPNGTVAYTRDGTFLNDSKGVVVDSYGHPLVWSGSSIPEGSTDVEVSEDGSISAFVNGTRTVLGKISIFRFKNAAGMDSLGMNLWAASESSGPAQSGDANTGLYGKIMGFALEASNVDMATEMTRMVSMQRSYQMAARALQQTDQMISQAIRMRSGG